MKSLILALFSFSLVALSPVVAQDTTLPELAVITAENAAQIEQLAMLGRGRMNELAYSPDGEILAIASSVGVWLYNPDDLNAEPRFLEGHTAPVTAIAFSPDGRYLASGSDDFMVRIWDVASGDEIATLRAGYTDIVTDVAFSPDGHFLITTGRDATLKLYETQTWTEQKQFRGGDIIAFSSDGSLLASTYARSNEIYVLHMDDLLSAEKNDLSFDDLPITTITTPSFTYEGETVVLSDIAFHPNSNILAVAGREISQAGVVQLWDVAAGNHIADFADMLFGGESVTFTSDGTTLISAGYDLRLWDVAQGIEAGGADEGDELALLPADNPEYFYYSPFQLQDVVTSPNGEQMATFSGDNYLQIWDIHTGEYTSVKFSGTEASSLEFTPDGSRLIAYTSETTPDSLTIWDIHNLTPLTTEFFGRSTVWSTLNGAAVSNDGEFLVYSYTVQYGDPHDPITEYYLKFLDLPSGETLRDMPVNLPSPANVFRPILSPDSAMLITGTNNYLYRWDVYELMQEDTVTEEPLLITFDYGSYVRNITFSPNENQLITVHDNFNTVVDIRNTETGNVLHSLTINEQFQQRHLYVDVDQVLFAGVAGTDTDEIEIWDVVTGNQLHVLNGNNSLTDVAFSPDGRFLVSARMSGLSGEPGILIWEVATGEQYAVFEQEQFSGIDAFAFNTEGTILISGHGDSYEDGRPGQPEYVMHLWDIEHQQELAALRGHTGSIHRIEFSPDGTLIATYGAEGVIRLWGVPTDTE